MKDINDIQDMKDMQDIENAQTVIEVSHLKKYYRDVKAVDDISFSVKKGELFGFLGVNGAGKSTTINMLCTLFPPTDGSAVILGDRLGKDDEKIKHHIGVVYQNNCLDDRLSVRENLLIRGGLYETDKAKLRKNLAHVTEILALSDVLKRPYRKLSGGQKRRAEIAAALMHAPDILFLDEPTTGLDPATRKKVWETVHDLQKEMEMTVFLTTHYMEEAARANHIAIMDHGKLISFGTPFELKDEFAKDKLRLYYKPDKESELITRLKEQKVTYFRKDTYISLRIDRTMDAMRYLDEMRNDINGFEVIQGTMDDVFLNVTGGERDA
mgnify:FL=1